jgi:hypothetical protein
MRKITIPIPTDIKPILCNVAFPRLESYLDSSLKTKMFFRIRNIDVFAYSSLRKIKITPTTLIGAYRENYNVDIPRIIGS